MQGFGLSDDLAVQTKNLSNSNNFNLPPTRFCETVIVTYMMYRDGKRSAEKCKQDLTAHADKCQCIQAEVSWRRTSLQFLEIVPAHILARATNPKQLWLSRMDKGVSISTVLMPGTINKPFETMVSGLTDDIFAEYDTAEEALRGHEKLRRELPKKIRNGEVQIANA